MVKKIKSIGVIGAGVMGSGITLVSARSGYDVVMRDIEDRFVKSGMEKIEKFLSKSVEKGKISEEEKKQTLSRIKPTIRLEDVKDCQVIIEVIIEDITLKKKLFQELDTICSGDTIFATNTSTISITDLASTIKRPTRFIGMHFFNPAPIMKLVEVIRGLHTTDEITNLVKGLAESMGKTPIEVNDYPGFVSNRILMPMINEAAYCLMEGVATREAIDGVMKLGMAHPMGPLELADLIGLDTCLHIMEVLYEGFSDTKYRPCPLLRKMVKAGYLGRKGFYEYT